MRLYRAGNGWNIEHGGYGVINASSRSDAISTWLRFRVRAQLHRWKLRLWGER